MERRRSRRLPFVRGGRLPHAAPGLGGVWIARIPLPAIQTYAASTFDRVPADQIGDSILVEIARRERQRLGQILFERSPRSGRTNVNRLRADPAAQPILQISDLIFSGFAGLLRRGRVMKTGVHDNQPIPRNEERYTWN